MKLISICCLLISTLLPLLGQTTLTESQRRSLDSIATADVPPAAPGVATAVLRHGQVVYQKVAGFADFEDSTLISPNTRFNYCSNAKQFTALAVLLLADQGKLDLEQDLNDFFPALYPDLDSPITLLQLLTHRSGIRDVYELWALQGKTWWKQSYTNQDAIALLQQQHDLNFAPGSQYLYSNSNYILLAEVVAQVSGQPFTAYTKAMFDSLGMKDSRFVGPASLSLRELARPYFNFDTWSTYDWTWRVNGDGNLFTSLQDQITWERWVQTPSLAPIPARIIEQSQALSPLPNADHYGFGLQFGLYEGIPYRFHQGSTGAWKATFLRFPDQNTTILTMVNTGKTSSDYISQQMADLLLGLPTEEHELELAPPTAGPRIATEALIGIYLQAGSSFRFELVPSDQPDEVILKREGRSDTRLLRMSTNVFHQWNDTSFKQTFHRNEKGEMTLTASHWSHAPYTLTRPEADWTGFDANSIVGTFHNTEVNVNLRLHSLGGRNYEVQWGEKTRQGQLITPNRLLVGSYTLTVGKDILYLAGDRIRRVKFERVIRE